MEVLEILKLVTRRLNEAKLPYMVTGSTALAFYTQPRMTRGIDIVVALNRPRAAAAGRNIRMPARRSCGCWSAPTGADFSDEERARVEGQMRAAISAGR